MESADALLFGGLGLLKVVPLAGSLTKWYGSTRPGSLSGKAGMRMASGTLKS